MPSYLWTVKDRFGIRRALRIEAATTKQARNELQQQGYTELQLQTDDISFQLSQSDSSAVVSAEKQLEFLNEGRFTTSEVFRENLRDFGLLYALLMAGALWSIFKGWLLVGIVMAVCVPVLFVWRSTILVQGLLLEELFAAKEWRDWERVLRAARRLERYSRIFKLKQPQLLLAAYKAQAKAGLGDLAGALADFREFESDSKVARWFYLTQLAMVYDAAKDFEKSLESLKQATSEGPPSGALYLSYAQLLIMRKRDVVGARTALAQAELLDLPQLGRPFLPLCKGMIELESGNSELARRLLEEALSGLQRMSHHSMVGAAIRLAKTYLCLSLAACGDSKAAEKLFADVREYLVAIGERELLQRCENSLRQS